MKIEQIDQKMAEQISHKSEGFVFHDLNNSYLRGRAFDSGFARLREKDYVSENVSKLKRHPSGINIGFKTNSKTIKIKAVLDSAAYMAHMTAIGHLGFDLYALHEGKYVFVGTTKINKASYEVTLLDHMDGNDYEYRLYFPLYVGLQEAYIGVAEDATFSFVLKEQEKIVVYGTSITQGGCATRPGMNYTAILDRITDYEWINLGFSGSAHLEKEMMDILNEIDADTLFLEVEANNTLASLEEKLEGFVSGLKHKKIYIMSRFPFAETLFKAQVNKTFEQCRILQQKLKNVTFIDGRDLLSELDYEETVDGVHLTDLGFYILAKNLLKYLP